MQCSFSITRATMKLYTGVLYKVPRSLQGIGHKRAVDNTGIRKTIHNYFLNIYIVKVTIIIALICCINTC
jgi:hypothetical protein